MATETDESNAKNQARAQLESIQSMVKALQDGEEWEGCDPEEAIQEDPLEVSIRKDWYSPGEEADAPTDYKILLCTGGPACRIIGELGTFCQPDTVKLQYQDWGTPWTDLWTDAEEDEALLTYAQQFYYGEG